MGLWLGASPSGDREGRIVGRCYVVIRNRRSGKSRACGQPAGPDGVCVKHQGVHDAIHAINRAGLESLNEPAEDKS